MTPARVAWGAGVAAGCIAAVLRGWWQWPHGAALSLGLMIVASCICIGSIVAYLARKQL